MEQSSLNPVAAVAVHFLLVCAVQSLVRSFSEIMHACELQQLKAPGQVRQIRRKFVVWVPAGPPSAAPTCSVCLLLLPSHAWRQGRSIFQPSRGQVGFRQICLTAGHQ